jgi:hypothetical protein
MTVRISSDEGEEWTQGAPVPSGEKLRMPDQDKRCGALDQPVTASSTLDCPDQLPPGALVEIGFPGVPTTESL